MATLSCLSSPVSRLQASKFTIVMIFTRSTIFIIDSFLFSNVSLFPATLSCLSPPVGNLLLLASCLSCQVQEIQEGNNFTLTRKSYIPVKFVWRRQNITKQVSSLNNFYHKIPYITRKLLPLLHLLYLLLHLQHLCLYQYPHSPESSQLTSIQ